MLTERFWQRPGGQGGKWGRRRDARERRGTQREVQTERPLAATHVLAAFTASGRARARIKARGDDEIEIREWERGFIWVSHGWVVRAWGPRGESRGGILLESKSESRGRQVESRRLSLLKKLKKGVTEDEGGVRLFREGGGSRFRRIAGCQITYGNNGE